MPWIQLKLNTTGANAEELSDALMEAGSVSITFQDTHDTPVFEPLPGETRLFLCHDYKTPGRDEFCCETTVAEQRASNVHVREGIDEDSFVAMRTARDATLNMPALILPAVQVNMRAGQLPPVESNGICYLKIPIDSF